MSILPQTTDLDFPDNLPPLSDEATQALVSGTRRTTKVAAPPVKSHYHDWHQETVTLTPNHGPPGGTAGAVVMWRCARRGCRALREVKYVFKRPRRNQNPNAWSGKPAPGGA